MKENKAVNLMDESAKKLLKRKRILAIISVLAVLGLIIWFTFVVIKALNLSGGGFSINQLAISFKETIEGYGSWGVIVAFGIQMLQVVVSPIPGEVIEVGMGLCFGWFWGAVICLLGSALAAAIIMLFVKKFGIRVVELFVSVDKINEFRFINNQRKLTGLIFLLYIIPGTPKDPLIFFFGLTKIRTLDFVVIQTVARIPSVVSSTAGGELIVNDNMWGAVIVFAITGAVALIGLLCYGKIIKKLQGKSENKKTEEQKD
ncbi:MAG: TVP38/TMEM64 family protein [Clostridia bacterium]|nr:TVP38/TMEM64 family protein [Clostridia bacterium]MBR5278717.1 TVP38/TMEM64 family protein [Clostridia bacterium]